MAPIFIPQALVPRLIFPNQFLLRKKLPVRIVCGIPMKSGAICRVRGFFSTVPTITYKREEDNRKLTRALRARPFNAPPGGQGFVLRAGRLLFRDELKETRGPVSPLPPVSDSGHSGL